MARPRSKPKIEEHNRGPRARGYQPRAIDRRPPRTRILIVCEGAQTEPLYFAAFEVVNARVTVVGAGRNTTSLVKQAIRLRDECREGGETFDQVWAVFDRDSFRLEQFNRAFELAKREGISVAFTNEAFELWYLLHFMYCDAALSRTQYSEKLGRYLGKKYQKNDPSMYASLRALVNTAVKHARRLARASSGRGNPSTTVHLLVEELLKWVPGAAKKSRGGAPRRLNPRDNAPRHGTAITCAEPRAKSRYLLSSPRRRRL